LTEIYVASESDVIRLVHVRDTIEISYKLLSATLHYSFVFNQYGNNNKQIAATNMNRDSSRSHTILSVAVTQSDTVKNVKKASKLYIVDLAGSEKVSKTQASGLQLEEAKSINQSLATLGKVINALTDDTVCSNTMFELLSIIKY